jgi:nucleotide-binding universal stress UspA family protein
MKILVPIPSAANGKKVISKVADMAKALKANVTLFHVCYGGVGAFSGEATPETIKREEATEQKFCTTFMAKAAEDLKQKGVKVDMVCLDGLPSRQIVGYAQNKGYDLVVMGALDLDQMI